MGDHGEKRVLIAEDDPNDAFFLLHAFEQAGLSIPCMVARDGQEAIEHLRDPTRARE